MFLSGLDEVYVRVQAARKRLLNVIGYEWQIMPADQDSVAAMIAADEMLKHGEIEADPRWRVRKVK